jgi:hypothetical protein
MLARYIEQASKCHSSRSILHTNLSVPMTMRHAPLGSLYRRAGGLTPFLLPQRDDQTKQDGGVPANVSPAAAGASCGLEDLANSEGNTRSGGSKPHGLGTPATRSVVQDSRRTKPLLVLLQQSGTKDLGRSGCPFWWPILAASPKAEPCVFTSKTAADPYSPRGSGRVARFQLGPGRWHHACRLSDGRATRQWQDARRAARL